MGCVLDRVPQGAVLLRILSRRKAELVWRKIFVTGFKFDSDSDQLFMQVSKSVNNYKQI